MKRYCKDVFFVTGICFLWMLLTLSIILFYNRDIENSMPIPAKIDRLENEVVSFKRNPTEDKKNSIEKLSAQIQVRIDKQKIPAELSSHYLLLKREIAASK